MFCSVPSCFRHALLLAGLLTTLSGHADDTPAMNQSGSLADPERVTGTIYESNSERKKILFTFERSAVRNGDTIRVERKFLQPDGTLAAVENIVYQAGQLTDYSMSEPRADIFGDIQTVADPKKPGAKRILIDYCHTPAARKKNDGEPLQPDTLIADNLYPFIIAHWEQLLGGVSVKFRFVSLEQERTYVFQLAKESEVSLGGHPVVRLKMTPTNPLVSMMVAPLYFTLEKDGGRRLLNYVGRTTPRVKKGKVWKYLDAETVFDWK